MAHWECCIMPMYGPSLRQLEQKCHEIKNRTAWRRVVQGKVQPSGLTPTVHHTAREQGILKNKICTRTQLFICHVLSSYTFPVHLSGTSHTHTTQHNPPHFPVSLHSLACSALSSLDHIFSVPHARIFSNTTKLVGISCLCVLSHRNILQKIKGTSFKWGEKVGRGESWEPHCVCVCVPCLLDTLLLSGRDCGSWRSEVEKSKRSEMPVITTQRLASRFGLFNYSSMIAALSLSIYLSFPLPPSFLCAPLRLPLSANWQTFLRSAEK